MAFFKHLKHVTDCQKASIQCTRPSRSARNAAVSWSTTTTGQSHRGGRRCCCGPAAARSQSRGWGSARRTKRNRQGVGCGFPGSFSVVHYCRRRSCFANSISSWLLWSPSSAAGTALPTARKKKGRPFCTRSLSSAFAPMPLQSALVVPCFLFCVVPLLALGKRFISSFRGFWPFFDHTKKIAMQLVRFSRRPAGPRRPAIIYLPSPRAPCRLIAFAPPQLHCQEVSCVNPCATKCPVSRNGWTPNRTW